jgi:hypothetical protein
MNSGKFYRIKEICIDLGITYRTLRCKIENGVLPPLEHPNPINSRVAGYSHDTYQAIIRMLSAMSNVSNVSNLSNDVNNKGI